MSLSTNAFVGPGPLATDALRSPAVMSMSQRSASAPCALSNYTSGEVSGKRRLRT